MIESIKRWLETQLKGATCAKCRTRIHPNKVMRVRHRTAGVVPLCPECYQEEFEPWTAQGKGAKKHESL